MKKCLTFPIMVAAIMLAACSDDSSTGAPSGSCDTSALPASSLSFASSGEGCVAQESMDAVAFMSMVADYTNAGWLPVAANPQPNGDGEYVFSKQDGAVSHSVTLTTTGGNVTVVYVKTGDTPQTSDPTTEVPVKNASTCDLATAKLPPSELAWKPTFGGSCEVSQTISLASLQKFDTLLIAAGYEQKKLTTESFRYTIEKPNMVASTIDRDTLLFTYSMETFVGTFSGVTEPMTEKQKLGYELTEVARANLPADVFAKGRINNYGDEFYTGYIPSAVNCAYVISQLNKFGWNLKEGACSSYSAIKGSITYNGSIYTMTLYYNDYTSGDEYSIYISKG